MLELQRNVQGVSKQTQTDFSFLDMEGKLRNKEKEVEDLERKVDELLQKFRGFGARSGKDYFKRVDSPEVQNRFRTSMLGSSEKKAQKLRNSQIDPLMIEEFPKINQSNSVKIIEEPESEKARHKFTRVKKTLEQSIQKKSKSKPSQKINSLISDMLYQDNQNKKSWNDFVGQFRKDPALMKFLLDKKEKPRSGSSNKSLLATTEKSRPKLIKNASQRGQNIDWSSSELDSLVIKGIFSFQSDSRTFSSHQIEEFLQSKAFQNPEETYFKAINTFEKLKAELLLQKFYTQPISASLKSTEDLLSVCLNLLKARALIVKILRAVHTREDYMLKLISAEDQESRTYFKEICSKNQEIFQLFAYLKHCKLPISSFIYLGEDIQEKIRKDSQTLLSLYPDLADPTDFD